MRYRNGDEIAYVTTVYRPRSSAATSRPDGDEVSAVDWFPIDALADVSLNLVRDRAVPCDRLDLTGAAALRVESARVLDHLSIQCADYAASLAFYDAVLAPLGGAASWTSALLRLRRRA